MDASAYLSEQTRTIDRVLDQIIPSDGERPAALHAAMRHLLFPGGKRLRPGLAFAAAEAVGGSREDALPAAAAVELIHTYSLVHDDLPCMDDDSERRGRPTVHLEYGEQVAVLAGDALLAAGFEAVVSPVGEREAADPVAAAGVVRDLAFAAGSRALVGGQVDDLAFAPEDVDAAHVESVHERKSAALIAAAIVSGARLAGASETRLESLRQFGLEVGIAFQIADDLLDQDDDDACSLVRALGSDAARSRAEALLARALERIADLGERAEPLRALARFAVRRNG